MTAQRLLIVEDKEEIRSTERAEAVCRTAVKGIDMAVAQHDSMGAPTPGSMLAFDICRAQPPAPVPVAGAAGRRRVT